MRTADGIYFRVHLWDWRGQPDIEAIDRSMTEVYNGSSRPLLQAVPDTGMDSYAVIVSSGPFDPQAAWNLFMDNDWNDDGEECSGLCGAVEGVHDLLCPNRPRAQGEHPPVIKRQGG